MKRDDIIQFEVNDVIYRWRKDDIFDIMNMDSPFEFVNIVVTDILDIGKPSKFWPMTESSSKSSNFMVRYECHKIGSIKLGKAHITIGDMPSKIREIKIDKVINNN